MVADPRDWIPPVAADQIEQTALAAVVLACCFAVVALAALTVLATALGAMASARLRETSRHVRDR